MCGTKEFYQIIAGVMCANGVAEQLLSANKCNSNLMSISERKSRCRESECVVSRLYRIALRGGGGGSQSTFHSNEIEQSRNNNENNSRHSSLQFVHDACVTHVIKRP